MILPRRWKGAGEDVKESEEATKTVASGFDSKCPVQLAATTTTVGLLPYWDIY